MKIRPFLILLKDNGDTAPQALVLPPLLFWCKQGSK